MTRLIAENLNRSIRGRVILDDVSLSLKGGQFVAVIGPNGAGKTTLLRALAGLAQPDSGNVTLNGHLLRSMNRHELARVRAYIAQNARAEWPISTREMVALGLIPHMPAFARPGRSEWVDVENVLQTFDLAAKAGQSVTTLSGGELARAMLARAIAGKPMIVIADEPLSNLDPRHAIDGIARLRGLADEGRLVIASIHDLTLAARHATDVLLMKDGGVTACGQVEQVMTAAALSGLFDVDVEITGRGGSVSVSVKR